MSCYIACLTDPSACEACGESIEPGFAIVTDELARGLKTVCPTCGSGLDEIIGSALRILTGLIARQMED